MTRHIAIDAPYARPTHYAEPVAYVIQTRRWGAETWEDSSRVYFDEYRARHEAKALAGLICGETRAVPKDH